MTYMFSKRFVKYFGVSLVSLGLSYSATAGHSSRSSSQAQGQAAAPAAQAQSQAQAQEDMTQCLAQKEINEFAPLVREHQYLGGDEYIVERHEYVVITTTLSADAVKTIQTWANYVESNKAYPEDKELAPKMALGCSEQDAQGIQEIVRKLSENSQLSDTHDHRVVVETTKRNKHRVRYTWTTSRRTPMPAAKTDAPAYEYDFNTEFNKAMVKGRSASKSRK